MEPEFALSAITAPRWAAGLVMLTQALGFGCGLAWWYWGDNKNTGRALWERGSLGLAAAILLIFCVLIIMAWVFEFFGNIAGSVAALRLMLIDPLLVVLAIIAALIMISPLDTSDTQ
jgi:hypothetical protein